jgi:Putative beta barrel porin-7 (BBP7)
MLRRGPAMIGEEMHWILGVRYGGLKENLTIESLSQSGGLRVGSFDTFATKNQFVGGQFGGRWNWNVDRLSIDFIWKLAVGAMNQEVDIDGGSAAALSNGAHIERPGGLLALSSNIGDYNRTKLVVMRDVTLNIGYAITPNVKFNLGYNLFWVSSVIRPGEQIDLGVNPALLPFSGVAPTGPARPAFHFNGEEFWMHGINVGLSVQF